MNQVGTAFVEVKPDLSGFQSAVNKDLQGASSGIKSKFAAVGKTAALGLAAGVAGFAVLADSAISAASDINESLSKNDKLFGRYAKGVEKFASSSAKSYGISKKAALEYTGVFGNLFRALGQSEKDASSNSIALTKLASDMASFNNTSVEDALEAIRSGLVGETEPLRRFGVNMSDATLKQQALRDGLIETTKDALTPQVKAIAAQRLIMSQTEQAHGDFARTSGGLANQQKILKARLDDASAAIGARLLPFAVKAATALNDMLTAAQDGTGVFGTIKTAWDGIAGSFKGGGDSGERLRGIITALVDVSQGLAAIATAAWEKFGAVITAQLQNILETFGQVLEGATTALKGLVDLVAGVFTGDWGRAWDGVKAIFEGVWIAMSGVVEYAWETIVNVVKLGVIAIGTTIKAAAGALLDLGKWIVGKIAEGIKGVAGKLVEAAGWVKNRIVEAVQAAAGAYIDAGKFILNRVAEGVKTVTSALGEVGGWVKNRIVEFVQREAEGFKTIGSFVINRLADGLTTVTSALGEIGGWVKNRVVEFVQREASGFKNIGKAMIGFIVDGLKGGANLLIGFLNTLIGLINKIPGVNIGKISALAAGGTVSSAGVQELATGGQIRRGTRLTAPTVLMGEEAPRHPEYVIPTNPAYRGRALSLYEQLGSELGVRAFGNGGVFAKASGIVGDVGKAVGGAAKGVLNLPLKLLEKGASFILDQFPNPSDMLPDWLAGTGRFVIDKLTGWVKDKVKKVIDAAIPSGGGGGHRSGTNALAALLARKFGLTITSNFRTPEENARVNGDPNSSHMRGTPGNPGAHDFVPPSTAALAYAMNVLKAKWADIHDYGTGLHLHVSWFRKGGVIGDAIEQAIISGIDSGGISAPFVGSYANGGVVPRDGLAYVHQGESITPGNPFDGVTFQLVMGGQVIDERIELRIAESNRQRGQMMRAGIA